ncbi:MAG: CYTH domain-containing protein [Pseudomonadota bacterium]
MALEIERKFLLKDDSWRSPRKEGINYIQGYFSGGEGYTMRVRLSAKNDACLTIKSKAKGITRHEYEYQIPVEDARELLDNFCQQPLIEKIRYGIDYKGHTFEVDEFLGANQGLIICEVELEREDEQFACPSWLGKEVTDDKRYYNVYLAQNPYTLWK